MDFDYSHYYRYSELLDFLQLWAGRYPELIQLETIGKSYEGRDLRVAILTNRATGEPLDKPGYWIDGNTHASEVTGSAVCLYTIAYLLSHYGQKRDVTRLLDGYTIYILPRLAVDGAEQYLTTPCWLRSSPRLYPGPGERPGLYPEDVNGDGLILQIRIQDDCGAWKISPQDERIMLRREPDEFDGVYYSLLPEGYIRDYNGFDLPVAPTKAGVDFNRNYPNRWQPESAQKGAGEFPLSEPETRAEVEFWSSHRNINGFYTYHTYGGMILRPSNTYPDEQLPIADLEIYRLLGARAEALTGYPCVSVYHDFSDRSRDMLYGVMDDHAYDQYGWFGFTPELWNAGVAAGLEQPKGVDFYRLDPWHSESESLKLMQWNDQQLEGKGFIDWQEFQHPQLGAVEIGGWNMKQVWTNAPAQYLPDICQSHCQFTISHALMSPKLQIGRTQVRHLSGQIYHVVMQLQNSGFLPTYTSQRALEKQAVQPIRVVLQLPETAAIVMGQREQEVGHLEGRASKAFGDSGAWDFRRTVEWTISAPANSKITVRAIAERAGTATVQLMLSD